MCVKCWLSTVPCTQQCWPSHRHWPAQQEQPRIYLLLLLWVRLWVMSCTFTLKLFPHTVHLKGSSLLWLFSWDASSDSTAKVFEHVLHLWGFSRSWIVWWETSSEKQGKVMSQSRHCKGLNLENEKKSSSSILQCLESSLWSFSGRVGSEGCSDVFTHCVCWDGVSDGPLSSGKARLVSWSWSAHS